MLSIVTLLRRLDVSIAAGGTGAADITAIEEETAVSEWTVTIDVALRGGTEAVAVEIAAGVVGDSETAVRNLAVEVIVAGSLRVVVAEADDFASRCRKIKAAER